MTITITAFAASPDRGRGLARDMPVRWALEEAGVSYEVRLLPFDALKSAAHLRVQPFGQIPSYEEGKLALFESGAIVFHIAQRHGAFLPDDEGDRARAITWMFAAIGTIEPPILEREGAMLSERGKPWFHERQSLLDGRVGARLTSLSQTLGESEWLHGDFTVGDLMMATVLRRLSGTDLLTSHANLSRYVARAEARPAFERAYAAQAAVFAAAQRESELRAGTATGPKPPC